MNKKAFTLVELLVVIVIMGLLAVLLFPVAGRTREAARRVMCANNLRQHGIAWYLYFDEHNECFPKWNIAPKQGGLGTFTYWGGKTGIDTMSSGEDYAPQYRVLNRYLDTKDNSSPNMELFHCPDDTAKYDFGSVSASFFDYYGNSYSIYCIGFFIVPGDQNMPLSMVTNPRNKVMLESCNNWKKPGHGLYTTSGGPIMVLFVDGHVGGPYVLEKDFEDYSPDTTKSVIYRAASY